MLSKQATMEEWNGYNKKLYFSQSVKAFLLLAKSATSTLTPVTTVDSSGSIRGCFGDGGRSRDSVERSRSESEPGRRGDVGAEVADISISEVERD